MNHSTFVARNVPFAKVLREQYHDYNSAGKREHKCVMARHIHVETINETKLPHGNVPIGGCVLRRHIEKGESNHANRRSDRQWSNVA